MTSYNSRGCKYGRMCGQPLNVAANVLRSWRAGGPREDSFPYAMQSSHFSASRLTPWISNFAFQQENWQEFSRCPDATIMVKQEKRNKEAAPIFSRYIVGCGSHHYPRQGIFEADLQCNCSLIQTTSSHPPERGSSF